MALGDPFQTSTFHTGNFLLCVSECVLKERQRNKRGERDRRRVRKKTTDTWREKVRHEDRDLRKAWCWNVPPLAKWQACNQYRSITEADPRRTVCSSERNLTVMRGDISSDVTRTWNYKFLIALASAELKLTDRFHAALTCSFTTERHYTRWNGMVCASSACWQLSAERLKHIARMKTP